MNVRAVPYISVPLKCVSILMKILYLFLQDASLFDDSFSRNFASSTSQIRVTVTDDDEDHLDSTTVSLDPAGESRQHPDLNNSRLSSYGCDMDMETYQAELAEATNALLVADKC